MLITQYQPFVILIERLHKCTNIIRKAFFVILRLCSVFPTKESPPPPPQNLLISPTWKNLPHQMLISSKLNNNFYVTTQRKLHFQLQSGSCTIFILTLSSLYTQFMLILILIDVQYLQNIVFSFQKVQMVKITPDILTTHWEKFTHQLLVLFEKPCSASSSSYC